MIKVLYNELDGPEGVPLRLEAAGHAGYAPAGQDIVCAGASTLMQALVSLLAGEESTRSDAWDEPDGPRLAVVADAPQKPWVEGAFELAKSGVALLAERYPDNLRGGRRGCCPGPERGPDPAGHCLRHHEAGQCKSRRGGTARTGGNGRRIRRGRR